jgi:hypothetical protein
MKACGYCGRENDDAAMQCRECGTSFDEVTKDTGAAFRDFIRVCSTPLGLTITTGFGAILISCALFFIIGRLVVDVRTLPRTPVETYYSFFTSTKAAPFIVLAAAFPIFAICRSRFRGEFRSLATAIVVVLITALLAFLPKILPSAVSVWCSPAVLIGGRTDSVAGFYTGAALQIAVGAGLLILFRPQKSHDEKVVT